MLYLQNQLQKSITMQRIAFVFCLILLAYPLLAKEFVPYYHKVKAKSGDALTTLLSKYDLDDQACNINKFYDLNKLKKGAKIYANKEYFLPIKVFKYNGKSIRTSLNIEDLELALDIQKYNESLLRKGLRTESFVTSKIIWVPSHLMGCNESMTEKIKSSEEEIKVKATKEEKSDKKEETVKEKRSSKETVLFDLFGEKYKEVKKFDDRLKGQVFYISTGHGGPDPGTMCTDLAQPLCEDEYAYDVGLRLARDLTQHGATVHVIIQDENDGIRDTEFLDCDSDEKCNGKELPLRQLDRLKQRADHINRLYNKYQDQGIKVQKAIMIHVDSRSKEKRQDVFFYHWGNGSGKDLAYNMHSTFDKNYGVYQDDRDYKGYVSERGLYMLRKVEPTSVFVELANINNRNDHRRIMDPANRQALANWLFEGLVGFR
ncbi:MAG: hypothetical protein RLZZ546_1651 [Bacteroidota bacterium]|jgi:N-acetylmuramoyl-L-alanine amidase